MTDGCGFINLAALKKLRSVFGWETCPTAIQCRIAGAKVNYRLFDDRPTKFGSGTFDHPSKPFDE